MNPDILEIRFFSHASWVAASQGYRFGPGAESDVRSVARRAAVEIASGYDKNADRKAADLRISTAEAAFHRFVLAMIDGATIHRLTDASYPDDQIGELTFEAAKKSVCPLWPFCGKPQDG